MKYLYTGLGLVVILGVVGVIYHTGKKTELPEESTTTEVVVATVAVIPLAAEVSIGSTLKLGQFDVIATTSSLADGGTVRTSADGRAIIAHDAAIISSLDNNSEITINLSADKKQSRVAIITGRIWSKVARALQQDEVFEVYTPTMAAAVRGTSFGVSLDPKRSLLVTEGTVFVTRRNKDTGELISSSTILVTAGNTVEDDGINFIVRPTTSEDKDDWYLENNSADNLINNPDTIKTFLPIEVPATAGSPASPPPANISPTSPTSNAVVAATAPSISSVSPERFDLRAVDKVRIYGENFDSVDQVLLNGEAVEFLLTTTGVIVVNTTEFRDGEDTYDLIVASPSGKDSLNGAFELQAAQINLAITETRLAYDQAQNSLVVVRGPGMGEVDTLLINNKSVQFQIINAQELQAAYPFSDTTLSVEVRAKGQSAKSTVSP